MPTAAPPEPRPATPLPTAAAATPSTISELPTGPRRHGHDGERAEAVREDREQPCGEEREMVLRGRQPVRRERAVHRRGERDADGEPRVREAGGACAANAGEEKRADAEQRCREERAGRVVDPEGARVPLRRLAPRDRTGGD